LCLTPLITHVLQTSHITPLETGHLLRQLRPRLAVIHHLTVRSAQRSYCC